MSHVMQKGPLGYFWSKCLFSIFWMHITLRLICEKFIRIAVKISFLWGVFAATSVSASVTSLCLRNDTQNLTFIISYLNIVLFGYYLVVLLKFYTVLMCLHPVRNFVNHKAFSSKHVSTFFYRENMSFLNYITAILRALLAWRGSYGYSMI